MIGKNGGLYWEAMSVAKFLCYKVPYQFTRSKVQLKEITSEYHARQHHRNLQTKILMHNRLLSIQDRSKKEHAHLVYDHFNRSNF